MAHGTNGRLHDARLSRHHTGDLPGGRGGTNYEPPAEVAIPAYLEVYGYEAQNAASWKTAPGATGVGGEGTQPPRLELSVAGHEEIEGHTRYTVLCSLRGPCVSRLEWKVLRRLQELREDLHDSIKLQFGENYNELFQDSHFAHHGGVPGTTSRLRSWLSALAKHINSGQATPAIVARVLHYLEAPEPEMFLETLTAKQAVDLVESPVDNSDIEVNIPVADDRRDDDSKRPFRIKLQKNGRRLGMSVACSRSLGITRVQAVKPEGIVSEWNQAQPMRSLTEGCYILEVNGQSTVAGIAQELEHSNDIVILARKP
mmetsp:Transcript_7877/g.17361  ORF Transcript_7877/g.17361 Transcript_7877/m.17361 type:complete len:314 (-) Transcript_7877:100-1041(-)|eukprot:CAMPEP_0178426068 /NCGR_PEP_ID=MMETSP0689_2-20121128/29046_1 /TAXON_ID=160604 /ORGANISM="Amphidinium massartii, Strain CS-259" /LENGTH=313 /DNA_ID=CAMNT_0020047747 /DNA_START=42 /DNA_END=983 /DNA_ORIENTATION=+